MLRLSEERPIKTLYNLRTSLLDEIYKILDTHHPVTDDVEYHQSYSNIDVMDHVDINSYVRHSVIDKFARHFNPEYLESQEYNLRRDGDVLIRLANNMSGSWVRQEDSIVNYVLFLAIYNTFKYSEDFIDKGSGTDCVSTISDIITPMELIFIGSSDNPNKTEYLNKIINTYSDDTYRYILEAISSYRYLIMKDPNSKHILSNMTIFHSCNNLLEMFADIRPFEKFNPNMDILTYKFVNGIKDKYYDGRRYDAHMNFPVTKSDMFSKYYDMYNNMVLNSYSIYNINDVRYMDIKHMLSDIFFYVKNNIEEDDTLIYNIYDEIELWKYVEECMSKYLIGISHKHEDRYSDVSNDDIISILFRILSEIFTSSGIASYVEPTCRYYNSVYDRHMVVDDLPRPLTLFEILSAPNMHMEGYIESLPKNIRHSMLKFIIDIDTFIETNHYGKGFSGAINKLLLNFADTIDDLDDDYRTKLTNIIIKNS